VLESLEREYRRDEDWCNNEKANLAADKVLYMQQTTIKHQEQKEAFLKVRHITSASPLKRCEIVNIKTKIIFSLSALLNKWVFSSNLITNFYIP